MGVLDRGWDAAHQEGLEKMKFLKPVVFCAICVGAFFAAQHILMRDWSDMNNIYYAIGGIDEVGDDSIEVLFIGASEMQYDISPMKLYEDTGVRSYNLATPGQPISCSYYLLREALKEHSPSLVVLEATGLFFGGVGLEDDECWRYILDNLELSSNKIEMAEAYEEAVVGGDRWNALLPMIKYHMRWSELNASDFRFDRDVDYYSAGQWILGTVSPAAITLELIDAERDHLLTLNQEEVQYIENGIPNKYTIESSLYAPSISAYCEEYFLKMKLLCEEHGAQLLLVKVPYVYSPALLARYSWTESNYQITKSFADQHLVAYFDMSYDIDGVVDFTTDTFDGGIHLNARGAEKTTQALGEYLLQNYELKSVHDPQYESNLDKYRGLRDIAYLQSEMNFDNYMDTLLQNKDKWTILMAVKDNYVSTALPLDYDAFEKLGLQLIQNGEFWDAYVAIIERGTVRYEALSGRAVNYAANLESINVNMSSSGWYTVPNASIVVNGQEAALNGEGLNIVVFDNESGLVIDSASFDTYQESRPGTHRWWENFTALRAYEREFCFE